MIKKEKNRIECLSRIYRIHISNGVSIDVQTEGPISKELTEKLLLEDEEIGMFFKKGMILDIKGIKGISIPQKLDLGKIESNFSKLPKKLKGYKRKINLMPYQRINIMLKLEGPFTRIDYQKFLESKGNKISNFMGHDDIRDALDLKRIELLPERVGRGLRKYKVIDTREVEITEFRQLGKIGVAREKLNRVTA